MTNSKWKECACSNENATFKLISISDGMQKSTITQVVSSTSFAEEMKNN